MFTSRGQPVLRCAIYTRQSVARGEQDLTSCDVQHERCEDYVRAMQYEGWVALDELFDDLGVMVRGLVWAAEWDRELGLTKLVLDDITVDAFIDEAPVLAETLPARVE